jgi:hypothetical protein
MMLHSTTAQGRRPKGHKRRPAQRLSLEILEGRTLLSQFPRITGNNMPDTFGPGLLGSAQVTFNEPIDPATFTPDKVASFVRTTGATKDDLTATLTSVTPVAGSNNTSFNINFAATGTTGRYRLVIGPDIRDPAGNPMDQNNNGVPGETTGDQYTINFNVAGPKVTSDQPDKASTPIFSITVGFNEPMDATLFTADKVRLSGPKGDLQVSAVVPVPGSNFTQFAIVFSPTTTTGRYTLVIGPDIRDVYGNQLDQNGNFVTGETPGDQFTVQFSTPGPKIVSSTPAGIAVLSVDHVRVTFDTPMDPSSFTPDKVASFTGPSGHDITVTSVSVVPFTNNTQFDVRFAAQTSLGDYTMRIGPNIRDIYDNQMDQDGNLIPGEVSGDQCPVHFTLFTANLIANGDFEAGGGSFTNWSIKNQANSFGNWFLQTGTASPVNGFFVPASPDPVHAAMTDSTGSGSHILFQDFAVPTGITAATLSFDRFISNSASSFVTPNTLDFTSVANQQARVDILTTTADPFSVAAKDVLLNVFKTKPGDPSASGYTTQTTDLTAFLTAHQGETLRLRFAEVDNQFYFQFGVDRILLGVNTSAGGAAAAVPAKASLGKIASASAELVQGAALTWVTRDTEAGLSTPTTALPGPSLTPIHDTDRFFASTDKANRDHVFTLFRSEQEMLSPVGGLDADALADAADLI